MKLGTPFAILLTLLTALVLQVAYLPEDAPDWTGWLRPPWVLLCIVFWTLGSPGRIGLIGVWLLGFAADALQADPLGLNGAVFALAHFAVLRLRNRLRMYSALQHVAVIVVLVFGAEVLRQVARVMAADLPFPRTFWGPVLASALIWPFAHAILRWLRPRQVIA